MQITAANMIKTGLRIAPIAGVKDLIAVRHRILSRPAPAQNRGFAISVVNIPLHDRSRRVDQGGRAEVGILGAEEAFITGPVTRRISILVLVPQDGGIGVAEIPNPLESRHGGNGGLA